MAVFNWSSWFGMFVALFCTVLIARQLHRNAESSYYGSIPSCLYCIWAVMTTVSVPVQPRTERLRLFFILWVWFSFVMNLVFQAFFTSFLIEPGFEKQISSLEELKHRNVAIVCPKSEASFFSIDDQTVFDAMKTKIFFTESSSVKCLIHHVLAQRKEAIIAKDLDADVFFKIGTVCSLSDFNVITFYTSLMDRRDFLYEVINYSLQTYIESGMMIGIMNPFRSEKDSMTKRLQNSSVFHSPTSYYSLNPSHMAVTFHLLTAGYCLCLLLFLAEIVMSKHIVRRM
ncbi:hypothetical protein C0J52_24590 [Blattella germanica]|nr:hypothetical protein C0J52_24590 [Blattella germanica]